MFLNNDIKISIGSTVTAGAAGTTAISTTVLDMTGYDGVLIVVPVGTLTSGAVTSIKAQEGAASDMSDAQDLQGSNQTITQATDSDKVFYIDLFKPTKRYIRAIVSRGTANAVIGGVQYYQYNARSRPTTHGTNVTGEQWGEYVAEGTA